MGISKKYNPLITIFTPAFNRAHTIGRLYESLEKQTFRDFEWLVVDDGSSDNTREIIEGLKKKASFPIKFFSKENGGKHTAHNYALNYISGELFFTVDSDDWVPINSLSDIAKFYEGVKEVHEIGCIVGLKEYPDGSLISGRFPKSGFTSTFLELEVAGLRGERSLVFKTEVIKEFPFPIVQKEKFMTEGVIYGRYDRKYLSYITNLVLTTCEYQADGLSSNPRQLMGRNPGGYLIYFRDRIDYEGKILERIKTIVRYNLFNNLYKQNDISSYRGRFKILVFLLKPVNMLFKNTYR